MRKELGAVFTSCLLTVLLFVPLPGLHGSSIATAAYSIIENSGSALTQRSILDFTGAGISCADDGTNSRTVCTVAGGTGTFGGVNVQTSSYLQTSADSGVLDVMNCSSSCTLTLNGSPATAQTYAVISIGSTVATVSLNSKNYNGSSSLPALTTGQILYFGSDGTNYFGNMPFSASTNISFTASGNNVNVASSGSGPSANQNIRSFGGSFDGGGTALTTAGVTYVTVPFTCTVAAYNITVDTGTISFDVWKIATGTAIPTVTNTILSGGYLAISTGTALHSTSTALFATTAVSANDIIAVEIEAVSSATKASLVLQCNATT